MGSSGISDGSSIGWGVGLAQQQSREGCRSWVGVCRMKFRLGREVMFQVGDGGGGVGVGEQAGYGGVGGGRVPDGGRSQGEGAGGGEGGQPGGGPGWWRWGWEQAGSKPGGGRSRLEAMQEMGQGRVHGMGSGGCAEVFGDRTGIGRRRYGEKGRVTRRWPRRSGDAKF